MIGGCGGGGGGGGGGRLEGGGYGLLCIKALMLTISECTRTVLMLCLCQPGVDSRTAHQGPRFCGMRSDTLCVVTNL